MKTRLLISACLLGCGCRYDGESRPMRAEDIEKIAEEFEIVPFCPEIYGGLKTPREASEIVGDRVVTKAGRDVTREYKRGAEEAVRLAKLFNIKCALLKERSPSCGKNEIYDGTFSGKLRNSSGIAAERLIEEGIKVFGESEIEDLIRLNGRN
ncbi:MAG: DUF523 domain-containing protein [Clostridia bacterium]|nr:DUF523 domain-containing protein [Clostridia bacterium]